MASQKASFSPVTAPKHSHIFFFQKINNFPLNTSSPLSEPHRTEARAMLRSAGNTLFQAKTRSQ